MVADLRLESHAEDIQKAPKRVEGFPWETRERGTGRWPIGEGTMPAPG